jgi:hypothetical protein
MTNPKNPYFAQAVVNRTWSSFMGRGIVDPVDDFRASNPPTNGPLLEWLAQDFVKHGYDLKHLMRTIMLSQTYRLSSLPNETNVADLKNYSRSYRRRLPAETLLDAVCAVTEVQRTSPACRRMRWRNRRGITSSKASSWTPSAVPTPAPSAPASAMPNPASCRRCTS